MHILGASRLSFAPSFTSRSLATAQGTAALRGPEPPSGCADSARRANGLGAPRTVEVRTRLQVSRANVRVFQSLSTWRPVVDSLRPGTVIEVELVASVQIVLIRLEVIRFVLLVSDRSHQGHTLFDRRLFLSECRGTDTSQRIRGGGILGTVGFRGKPSIDAGGG